MSRWALMERCDWSFQLKGTEASFGFTIHVSAGISFIFLRKQRVVLSSIIIIQLLIQSRLLVGAFPYYGCPVKLGRPFIWQIVEKAIIFNGQTLRDYLQQNHIFMLTASDSKEALLKSDPSKVNKSELDDSVQPTESRSRVKKNKKERSEVTYILKFLNLIVGAAFLAFSVYCYLYGFDSEQLSKNAVVLRYVMPGYIGLSGLIILAIECRIGFVIRNMRFFYNYFGRGIFNIYAGVMPLTMISNFEDSLSTFEIITLVASSVMTLVGILYICLKIFCCEKEGDKIDKANKSEDSD